MGTPVKTLQDEMTAKDVEYWKLYEREKGRIGAERTDYLFASLCAAIHQLIAVVIATNGGGNTDPPTIEDCLLKFCVTDEKPELTAAERLKQFCLNFKHQ